MAYVDDKDDLTIIFGTRESASECHCHNQHHGVITSICGSQKERLSLKNNLLDFNVIYVDDGHDVVTVTGTKRLASWHCCQ